MNNNFGDDETREQPEENPKENLKDSSGGTDEEEGLLEGRPSRFGFMRKKWVRIPLRAGAGLVIIGFAISIYWNLMPRTFDVEKVATRMAVEKGHREEGEDLPRGYRTVATMIHIVDDILLGKPGGMMSNSLWPMSRWSDNMRSWERGAVVQMRVMVQGLRFDLSRAGPLSEEQETLMDADAHFSFRIDSPFLPSSEDQYRDGVEDLELFLQNLSESTSEAQYFVPRQDQLINWLGRQTVMLGDYTAKLQRNVELPTYNTGVLTANFDLVPADMAPPGTADPENEKLNGFFERDNTFYEVRGGVYVIYHMMLAIRKDGATTINNAQAMGVMNRILNELESANKPMRSPMVLNGREFGVVQNHSLVMASHIAKAHLAVQELQLQLQGGGRR